MAPRHGSASRPPRHCSNINESRDTLKRRADPAISPPIEADEKGRISAALFVELPGIEPGSDIGLSCRNSGIYHVK
jgi:hypothetical protein